jgi:hypothetical protein
VQRGRDAAAQQGGHRHSADQQPKPAARPKSPDKAGLRHRLSGRFHDRWGSIRRGEGSVGHAMVPYIKTFFPRGRGFTVPSCHDTGAYSPPTCPAHAPYNSTVTPFTMRPGSLAPHDRLSIAVYD